MHRTRNKEKNKTDLYLSPEAPVPTNPSHLNPRYIKNQLFSRSRGSSREAQEPRRSPDLGTTFPGLASIGFSQAADRYRPLDDSIAESQSAGSRYAKRPVKIRRSRRPFFAGPLRAFPLHCPFILRSAPLCSLFYRRFIYTRARPVYISPPGAQGLSARDATMTLGARESLTSGISRAR